MQLRWTTLLIFCATLQVFQPVFPAATSQEKTQSHAEWLFDYLKSERPVEERIAALGAVKSTSGWAPAGWPSTQWAPAEVQKRKKAYLIIQNLFNVREVFFDASNNAANDLLQLASIPANEGQLHSLTLDECQQMLRQLQSSHYKFLEISLQNAPNLERLKLLTPEQAFLINPDCPSDFDSALAQIVRNTPNDNPKRQEIISNNNATPSNTNGSDTPAAGQNGTITPSAYTGTPTDTSSGKGDNKWSTGSKIGFVVLGCGAVLGIAGIGRVIFKYLHRPVEQKGLDFWLWILVSLKLKKAPRYIV